MFEVQQWLRKLRSGWVLVAAVQAAAFVLLLPPLLKHNWAELKSLFGSEYMFGVVSPWLVHVLQLLLNNLIFGIIYSLNWRFFEQYKISSMPWPWRSEKASVRADFWAAVWRAVGRVVINNVFIALPLAFVGYSYNKASGAFSTSLEDWPSTWTIVWQIAACFVLEDAIFYHTHRLLHWKVIYPYVHKRHHELHHTVVIGSENNHPIEYLLNVTPVLLGPLLLKAHMVTYWLFIFARVMESTDGHSGYEFPWSVSRLMPFANTVGSHDYHHSRNIGCFGSQFWLWDSFYGTDTEYHRYEAKREAARAAAAAGKAAADALDTDVHPDAPGAAPTGSDSGAAAAKKAD